MGAVHSLDDQDPALMAKSQSHTFRALTTLSPQPTMTAEIEDMHSLSHETHTWVYNRRNGINASNMAAYLQETSSAGGGWSLYEYIPKMHYADLLSRKSGSGGWGLYMVEGMNRRSKVLGGNVLLTIVHL
jgi:hypothetical protein